MKNTLTDQSVAARGLIGSVLTRWNDERNLIPIPPGATTPPALLIADPGDPCSASSQEFETTIGNISDLIVQLELTGDPQYQSAIEASQGWISWLRATQALCTAI
jgi:hypothetical protein